MCPALSFSSTCAFQLSFAFVLTAARTNFGVRSKNLFRFGAWRSASSVCVIVLVNVVATVTHVTAPHKYTLTNEHAHNEYKYECMRPADNTTLCTSLHINWKCVIFVRFGRSTSQYMCASTRIYIPYPFVANTKSFISCPDSARLWIRSVHCCVRWFLFRQIECNVNLVSSCPF